MIQVHSLFFFKIFICKMLLQLFTTSRTITATTTVVPFCFQGQLWGGFPSIKNFLQPFNHKWTTHWKFNDSLKIQWYQWPVHLHLKNQLEDHKWCDIWQNGKVIDRINKSGCLYSLQQYEKDTPKPNKIIFNTKSNKF